LALAGGDWSASHPTCFTPEVRAPGTHWIRVWVGPRASLDTVAKRKNFHHCPCQELNPGSPACIVEKPPRNSAEFCGEGQGLSWAVEPRKEERSPACSLVSILTELPWPLNEPDSPQ